MKGHVWRGVFGGFIFGILLALTLFIYGVLDFASDVMWILPLAGILLGLVLAAWAPFGSGAADSAPATDTPQTGPVERETTLEQPPVDELGGSDGGDAAV